MDATTNFTTDMNALAALRSDEYYDRMRVSCNPCEICGKEIKPGTGKMVRTEQGDYPIGSSCRAKAKRAGFEIVDA